MRLPVVSGRELVKVLSKIGYVPDHQTGSHIILRNVLPPHKRLTVPEHKEISVGTLSAILRQANLSRGDFAKLLEKSR